MELLEVFFPPLRQKCLCYQVEDILHYRPRVSCRISPFGGGGGVEGLWEGGSSLEVGGSG